MSKISDERLWEMRNFPGRAHDLDIALIAEELVELRNAVRSFPALEPQQEEAVALLPDNLLSHRASWLRAMDRLIELEPESTEPDMDEKGYWRHERQAMLDMYAYLEAHPTPVQKVQESQTVSEETDANERSKLLAEVISIIEDDMYGPGEAEDVPERMAFNRALRRQVNRITSRLIVAPALHSIRED